MIRSGEVEVSREALFDVLKAVEFSAIIRSDGMKVWPMGAEQLDEAIFGGLSGGAWELAEAKEARFTLDQAEGTGLIGAVNGIRFPVSRSSALLDDCRTLRNQFFTGQSAPAVVTAMAFAAFFSRASQMQIE